MNEQTIFLAALEIADPAERSAYVDRACAGDAALRRQVEALFAAHERSGEFLDVPALEQIAAGKSDAGDGTVALGASAAGAQNMGPREDREEENTRAFLQPSAKPGSLGRLGHYEILEVIGKGGFGTVLKAFDDKLHRVVAIKVLSLELSASGMARQRFIREARAAAAVTHEHVVTIHAVEEEHRPPYLVMQLIDGVTLQEKLDKTGTLGLREILRIGVQMAEGLAAAHKQGLVHRDIKPANVLLENGIERVKITDFGLARAFDDASVTQSGVVAGTPTYMSPEQANGLSLDHRSDLFSLGTVLYVMCTGRPPFRATGTMGVLKRVIDDTPRPVREINPEIPDWLEAIIAKLHAKKREDRFQSAMELAEVLGQHLAQVQQPAQAPQPVIATSAAPQPSARLLPSTDVRAPRARKRWLLAKIAAFLVLVALGVWTGPWLLRVVCNTGSLWVSGENQAVKLVLSRDGEIVKEITGLGYQGFDLPAGNYTCEATYDKTRWTCEFEVRATQSLLSGTSAMKATDRLPLSIGRGEYLEIRIMLHPVRLANPKDKPVNGWVQLFNGKDMAGWFFLGNLAGGWKVDNQIVTGACNEGRHVTFVRSWPASPDKFTNFHLRADVRLKGPGKGGILFRGVPNNEFSHIDGCEVEIAEHSSGSIALGDARIWLDRKQHALVQPDSWFTLELIADGPMLTTRVNGQLVAGVSDVNPAGGWFCLVLDARQGPVVVEFKKLEVKELPATPLHPAGQEAAERTVLGWGRIVDPTRKCWFEQEALYLRAPGGHFNLNPLPPFENVLAPRVLQKVGGDFAVEVKVESFARPKAKTSTKGENSSVGAGLLLWQDGGNFARFVRAANGDTGKLTASLEILQDGRLLFGRDADVPDTATYLRAQRREGKYRFDYSSDGSEWKEMTVSRTDFLPGDLDAGVAATNSTRAVHSARFHDLRVTSSKTPGKTAEPPVPLAAVPWGEWVDPKKDCKHEYKEGRLTISIPAGVHNLSHLGYLVGVNYPKLAPAWDNQDAPRVLQVVEGDFTLRVKLPNFPPPDPNTPPLHTDKGVHGAGLVVWQDAGNFATLLGRRVGDGDPKFDDARTDLQFFQADKRVDVPHAGLGGAFPYAQIERRGQTLFARTSKDGMTWKDTWKPITKWKLPPKLKVGVVAVNFTRRAFSFTLEDFHLERPKKAVTRVIRFDPLAQRSITANGVTAAEEGWKIQPSTSEEATFRLFELRDLELENCRVTLRGRMKPDPEPGWLIGGTLAFRVYPQVLGNATKFTGAASMATPRGATSWTPCEASETFHGRPNVLRST